MHKVVEREVTMNQLMVAIKEKQVSVLMLHLCITCIIYKYKSHIWNIYSITGFLQKEA